MNNKKIEHFKDLIAWQEGHKLVLLIYEATKLFPKEESYSLTSQMRRAAVSLTSNIAEGFGRHSYPEKIHFYYMAKGSLTELENQLQIAIDIVYIKEVKAREIQAQILKCHELLHGLIRKSKSFVNP